MTNYLTMIDTFLSSPLVALLLVPFIVSLVARKVRQVNDRLDKERTLDELEAAPHVFVGATYAGIMNEAGDAYLCGPCILTKLELGRVEVRVVKSGYVMNWSGAEFKRLHPVYVDPKAARNDEA